MFASQSAPTIAEIQQRTTNKHTMGRKQIHKYFKEPQ